MNQYLKNCRDCKLTWTPNWDGRLKYLVKLIVMINKLLKQWQMFNMLHIDEIQPFWWDETNTIWNSFLPLQMMSCWVKPVSSHLHESERLDSAAYILSRISSNNNIINLLLLQLLLLLGTTTTKTPTPMPTPRITSVFSAKQNIFICLPFCHQI